jgi:hypothetical protein
MEMGIDRFEADLERSFRKLIRIVGENHIGNGQISRKKRVPIAPLRTMSTALV